LKLNYFGATDVGRRRKNNEDYFGIFEPHDLFVVADGMGGHAAGEVASEMAVRIISREIGSLRGVPDEEAALTYLERLAGEAKASGLGIHWGRKVLEVRPPVPIDKGQAVRTLVTGAEARFALYAGDDATDLDALDALEALVSEGVLERAVRVGVSSDEGPAAIVERADLVVDGVDGFGRVLARLAET